MGENYKCRFKTADGIWWDIGVSGKLSKTMVAFKKENLKKAYAVSNKEEDAVANGTFEAFYLMTKIDENSGVRILDMVYGRSSSDKYSYIINNAKIYAFLYKKHIYDYFDKCPDNENEKKGCINLSCYETGGATRCTAQLLNNKGEVVGTLTKCDTNGINCGNYSTKGVHEEQLDSELGWAYVSPSCDSQGENCNTTDGSGLSYRCYKSNASYTGTDPKKPNCRAMFDAVSINKMKNEAAEDPDTAPMLELRQYRTNTNCSPGQKMGKGKGDCKVTSNTAIFGNGTQYYYVTIKNGKVTKISVREEHGDVREQIRSYETCNDFLRLNLVSKCPQ